MGSEPDYFFNYAVARREPDDVWWPLDPSLRFSLPGARPRTAQLHRLWTRIWTPPDGPAQAASATPAISASK